MKYSIEELIVKFQEHAEKLDKNNKNLIHQFIENNPNEPLPEHFLDDFNLPLALSVICSEVLNIKRTYITYGTPTTEDFSDKGGFVTSSYFGEDQQE